MPKKSVAGIIYHLERTSAIHSGCKARNHLHKINRVFLSLSGIKCINKDLFLFC